MNNSTNSSSRCAVCGNRTVELVPAFARLPRVTSDTRPFPEGGKLGICSACGTVQKPADAQWEQDAAAIYARYDIFRQAIDGAEQRVFDQASSKSVKRSELVMRRLNQALPFGKTGRVLDVGCGNGPTLRALSEIAPGWQLFGHDISAANAEALNKIPGFAILFTGDPAKIDEKFDLITFSHSLEHVPDPVKTLADLRTKLATGGRLVVEVPNLFQNVYDLVVADHRSHFDPLSLANTARRAGFDHFAVFDDWAFKELTLIASDMPLMNGSELSECTPFGAGNLGQRVEWLLSVVEEAKSVADNARQFGLFGTAIAATWLSGPLGKKVNFFVDEDANRVGRKHEERPIYGPDQIPEGAAVFVPLVPQVAAAVAARLSKRGVDVRLPPPQEFPLRNQSDSTIETRHPTNAGATRGA